MIVVETGGDHIWVEHAEINMTVVGDGRRFMSLGFNADSSVTLVFYTRIQKVYECVVLQMAPIRWWNLIESQNIVI